MRDETSPRSRPTLVVGNTGKSLILTQVSGKYIIALMSGGWPSSIDPVQLAEKGTRLAGELTLAAMPRLLQACPHSSGSVNIDLRFERGDPDGLRIMHGTVRAIVRATCQR